MIPQTAINSDLTNPQDTKLSLTAYLFAVKSTFNQMFDHDVWVTCEIRAMNTKGGHYYFELADKDADDTLSASCRGTLWHYSAAGIIRRFESSTNVKLGAGLKVLLRGRATFHAQFGFSFNITDIDPSFTLGELAQAYQQMKNKLEKNGLLTLNKAIPMPFDIQKVAVVAPENAAGLGDFRAEADRLMRAKVCQFEYYYATFQGNDAPKSVRQAIYEALSSYDDVPFDILVIIRGGGAVGDLAYLNDYELAATVAEVPVPVWVGIGHERDTVILDEVAHTSFDTPSKVIYGIEAHITTLWQDAKATKDRMDTLARALLQRQRAHLSSLFHQVRLGSHHAQSNYRQDIDNQLRMIRQASFYHINQARADSEQLLTRHQIYRTKLHNLRGHIKQLQSYILSRHPNNNLNQGYALVRNLSGQLLTSQNQIQPNMTILIQFKDGSIQALAQPREPSQSS